MGASALIGGFLNGRQTDWKNRIAGPDKGTLLSQSRGKKLVHVGVHRTGATFLQQVVLPAYPESASVFSDDVIAGKLFDNGLDNVERLHSFVGNVGIMVVLRNQVSLINSAYRTYVKAGGTWGYARFADKIIACEKYDFAALIDRYADVFGRTNVHVFFYEDLVADWDYFLAELVALIGAPTPKPHPLDSVNPGPTRYLNAGVRLMNLLLAPAGDVAMVGRLRGKALQLAAGFDTHIIKYLAHGPSAKRQFGHKRVSRQIREAYRESNLCLATVVGRDLEALGYAGGLATTLEVGG